MLVSAFQMFKQPQFPAHIAGKCQPVAHYHVAYELADIFLIIGKQVEQILNSGRLVMLVCKRKVC